MSTENSVELGAAMDLDLGFMTKEELEEFAVKRKCPDLGESSDDENAKRLRRFAKVGGTQAWNILEFTPTPVAGMFAGKCEHSERRQLDLNVLNELRETDNLADIEGLGIKSQKLLEEFLGERIAFLAGVERPAGQQG